MFSQKTWLKENPNQCSVDNGTIKRSHFWTSLLHCSLGCIFRVKWVAGEPPLISAFWKAVCSRASTGLFPTLVLCHCFALPPCVQRQNHTHAVGRKPSASAVAVSAGNAPARWRESARATGLPPITGNYRRLPEFFHSSLCPRPWEGAAVGGKQRHPQETVSSSDFYTVHFEPLSSRGLEKYHLTSIPSECHKSVLRLKNILFKRRCRKSQSWQLIFLFHFN